MIAHNIMYMSYLYEQLLHKNEQEIIECPWNRSKKYPKVSKKSPKGVQKVKTHELAERGEGTTQDPRSTATFERRKKQEKNWFKTFVFSVEVGPPGSESRTGAKRHARSPKEMQHKFSAKT